MNAQENLFRSKSVWLIVCFILVLLFLFLHLFRLQVVDAGDYRLRSEKNRLVIYGISPARGNIYDRHGSILATNKIVFNLVSNPQKLDVKTVGLIENFLPRAAVNRLRSEAFQKAKNEQRTHFLLLDNIDQNLVAVFSARQHLYDGISIEAVQRRFYPLKNIAAHVTGYISRLDEPEKQYIRLKDFEQHMPEGRLGIEQFYDAVLRGVPGQLQAERNAQGEVMEKKVLANPKPGSHIYTSIDVGAQSYLHQLMKGRIGAAAVIDIRDGGLLASVSRPSFDPNRIFEFDYRKQIKKGALFNRVIRGQYPPASTIKPFMALAALENGVVTPEEKILSKGFYQLPGSSRKFRDWKRGGHGLISVADAISQSSDDVFYELSYRLGIEKMHQFLKKFGFGKATGIDMPFEQLGLLPSKEWKKSKFQEPWYRGETLIAGIGQGYVLTTPIQMTAAVATLASRGVYKKPRVAVAIENALTGDIKIIKSALPQYLKLSNEAHWDVAFNGMLNAIEGVRGTARNLRHKLTYKMAGKTGTAQVTTLEKAKKNSEIKSFQDHALFVAFAPFENPVFAVAIFLENAGGGSTHAAPIAQKIMDFLIKNLL